MSRFTAKDQAVKQSLFEKSQIKRMILMGVFWFLLVHVIFLYFYYYWNIAIEIPIVICGSVFILAYILCHEHPSDAFNSSRKNHIDRTEYLLRVGGIRIIIMYLPLYFMIAHLNIQFDISSDMDKLGWKFIPMLFVGYVFLFLIFYPSIIAIMFCIKYAYPTVERITKIKNLFQSVFSVFILYVLTDILFACFYRLIFLHNPKAFGDAQINSFTDSVYFSTVTMTTLGYGEITPATPLAKWIVITHTLFGIFLLAAMLGSAISLSSNENGTETKAGDLIDKEPNGR